jgi:hypothetical protein
MTTTYSSRHGAKRCRIIKRPQGYEARADYSHPREAAIDRETSRTQGRSHP